MNVSLTLASGLTELMQSQGSASLPSKRQLSVTPKYSIPVRN